MDRQGTVNNPIPNVIAGSTIYFWCVLLPSGEELQICTRLPIPLDTVTDINRCEILAAQVYPRRLDSNV
jgi:hypothetical protein